MARKRYKAEEIVAKLRRSAKAGTWPTRSVRPRTAWASPGPAERSSVRLRWRWLIAQPGWRVVRARRVSPQAGEQ
jgi:hypothetical protein